ncbi:probable ABC transporter permease protein YurN [Arthrobacter sp. Hiyo8]|nr:probable ABC transporter permease protein YurN [Arthrobacter sp. Hiyo8]
MSTATTGTSTKRRNGAGPSAATAPEPGRHNRKTASALAALGVPRSHHPWHGLFTLVPIVASVVLAFFRWDIISAPSFVGFDNFAEVVQDPTVRVSFLNTILFVVVAVALQLGLALALAIMVQEKLPAWLRVFFRSAFFFPLILSAASVSIFMRYLFNEQFGVVNWLLSFVGIPPSRG